MPSVVVTRGGQFVREVPMNLRIIGIGRDTANDICLPDGSNQVSRFHAVLLAADEPQTRWFIRDLSSPAGVRVNGAPVYQRVLADGDVVEIAEFQLRISLAAEGSGAPRIRIVSQKRSGTGVEATIFRSAPDSGGSGDRSELLRQLGIRAARAADPAEILAEFMPAIVSVMSAHRGFGGMFGAGGYTEAGVAGLAAGEQIEISTEDFLDRLQAGEAVEEQSTLLVPVRGATRPCGFICVERMFGAAAFTSTDVRFLDTLGRAVGTASSKAEPTADAGLPWPGGFIGKSRAFKQLLREVVHVAASGAHVLVQGESGAGKELVAQHLHLGSVKRNGPFLARNCAAITESLAESEIFGYAPRAGIAGADPAGSPGWFEMANRGVLFLDEIHALTLPLQDKLLRVFEERQVWRVQARAAVPVDVMVIGATDQSIEDAVERGAFRKALYHRFVHRLQVPPLRDRPEDIRLLVHYFLDKATAERGTRARSVSYEAMVRLMGYSWPGNVRELQNCIVSSVLSAGEVLFSWQLALPASVQAAATPAAAPVIKTMADVEREKIIEALTATQGNITRAAKALGYGSRTTILNKMDEYGIPRQFGDV
jgi:DNA-binding NtrC family response regulator